MSFFFFTSRNLIRGIRWTCYFWCIFFIAGACLTAAFIQKFVSNTTQQLNPPTGTQAHDANAAFAAKMPSEAQLSYFNVFITYHGPMDYLHTRTNVFPNPFPNRTVPDIPTVQNFVSQLNTDLTANAGSMLSNFGNYYLLHALDIDLVANHLISPNGRTLTLPVIASGNRFSKNATKFGDLLQEVVTQNLPILCNATLLNTTKLPNNESGHWNPAIANFLTTGTNGLPIFLTSIVKTSKRDMMILNAVVMPIALLLLVYCLKGGWRFLIPSACVLGMNICLSFGSMYGITKVMAVASSTPLLMFALVIPFSMTTCVTMFSKYLEILKFVVKWKGTKESVSSTEHLNVEDEKNANVNQDDGPDVGKGRIEKGHVIPALSIKTKDNAAADSEKQEHHKEEEGPDGWRDMVEEALVLSTRSVGYAIFVANFALSLALVALTFFPADIIQSLAIGCLFVVISTVLTSLIFIPAVLLSFPGFFGKGAVMTAQGTFSWKEKLCCCGFPSSSSMERKAMLHKGVVNPCDLSVEYHSARGSNYDQDLFSGGSSTVSPFSCCCKCCLTKGNDTKIYLHFPVNLLVVLLCVGLCLGVGSRALHIRTSDSFFAYLGRGATATKNYATFIDNFGYGFTEPFRLLFTLKESFLTQFPNASVLSPLVFNASHMALKALAQDPFIGPKIHLAGPLAIGPNFTTLSEVMNCLDLHVLKCDFNLLPFIFSQVDLKVFHSFFMMMTVNFDPAGKKGWDFYQRVLQVLKAESQKLFPNCTNTSSHQPPTPTFLLTNSENDSRNPYNTPLLLSDRRNTQLGEAEDNNSCLIYDVYVEGMAPDNLDAVHSMYARFPIIAAVTAAVIFVVLVIGVKSVLLAVKTVISTALTEAFVFGILALTYQMNPGLLDWTSWVALQSIGYISWIAPIIGFAVILGISVFFDVLAVSSLLEILDEASTNSNIVGFPRRRKNDETNDDDSKKENQDNGKEIEDFSPFLHESISSQRWIAEMQYVYSRHSYTMFQSALITAVAMFGLMLSDVPLMNLLGFAFLLTVLWELFVIRPFFSPCFTTLCGPSLLWPQRRGLCREDCCGTSTPESAQ